MTEEEKEIEELRPDTVANPEDRKKAIERAKANGNINKWGAAVFDGPDGQKVIESLKRSISRSGICPSIYGLDETNQRCGRKVDGRNHG